METLTQAPDVPAAADDADPGVFALGGNGSTLAVIDSFIPSGGAITARLVPVAFTPLGATLGDAWQNVGIAAAKLFDWADRTFPPEDDRSFIAPARDAELLLRIGWHAPLPAQLDPDSVLNAEDLPEDILEALARPPAAIVQCAVCRRLCVRDEFVAKERQLCAWDYHAQTFGRRGPWRTGPYEARHFETLPAAAYVAPDLLADLQAEIVMLAASVEDAAARDAINVLLTADAERPHLAVRTTEGYALLRESRDGS